LENFNATSFPGPFAWLAGGAGKGPRPQSREKALETKLPLMERWKGGLMDG